MALRSSRGAVILLATLASGCGGSSSTSRTPTAPTPRVASVAVESLTASTERQDNGNLSYVVAFQVRESAGVGTTISSVEITASGGVTGTTTIPGNQLSQARIAASAAATYRIRLTTNSTAQATQISVRVAHNDDNNNPGAALATASVAPAPPPPVALRRHPALAQEHHPLIEPSGPPSL
jgi:hypothetical protein